MTAMWTAEPDTIKVSLVFKVDAYRQPATPRRRPTEMDVVFGTPARTPSELFSAALAPFAGVSVPSLRRNAPVLVAALVLLAMLLFVLRTPSAASASHKSAPSEAAVTRQVDVQSVHVAPSLDSACTTPVAFRTVAPR